jgi:hypothetical protein
MMQARNAARSAASLDTCTASPEKHAPQYGGYCAFAVTKGVIAKGGPMAWAVNEAQLFRSAS